MKTILVTGGSGFIGNCFCKLILSERSDWKVLNIDVETYAANHKGMSRKVCKFFVRLNFHTFALGFGTWN